MKKNYVQTIPIDPDGKYIFIIEDTERNIESAEIERLKEDLQAFQQSEGEKFFIIALWGNVKVKVEKIGGKVEEADPRQMRFA